MTSLDLEEQGTQHGTVLFTGTGQAQARVRAEFWGTVKDIHRTNSDLTDKKILENRQDAVEPQKTQGGTTN